MNNILKNTNEPSIRLYYLDWLRVLAMLGVFFYHNARFFDELADWHIKNTTTNIVATSYIAFVGQWGMPLFFLLAGAGTYYALKAISARQYVLDRTLRLVIPLIFGMLVIVVPQAYFEAIHHGGELNSNFFLLYVQYLKTLPELDWYHLWFLEHLFIFSIVTIPIFIILRRQNNIIISNIAKALGNPWLLLLVSVLSIAAANAFLYPAGFWGTHEWSGWNIICNLLFYIFGYLLQANERIIETIKRLGWIALTLGIIAATCLFLYYVDTLSNLEDYYGTGNYFLAQLLQSVNAWSWIIAIFSMASRCLTQNNGFLKYANEAVLPFYILHQTVIIVIGFYVVQWNSGIGLKYLVITSTSFIAIMAIYEFLIRRFNISRFLFGMRPKRKATVPH